MRVGARASDATATFGGQPGSPRRHGMVVDDSAVAREVMSAVLSREFTVTTAADPLIAMDKIAHACPDVILLDLEMPRMHGLTFLRKIREETSIPVVICSSLLGRGTDVALRALEDGAVDVVAKPPLGVRGFLDDAEVVLLDTVRGACQARPRRSRATTMKAFPALAVSPAPQVQAAQTPAPTPQAPPQPAAPEVPLPAFTQPAQPTHAAPAGPVDLNRLQQMIQSAQHASGEKTSSARRGTVKAQTNPNVGAGAAQGPSASQLAGLEQLLERLWNPNCDVPGGDTVKLKVRFTVGLNGNLIGDPDAGGLEQSGGAVVSAAARRAVDAVRQAEPYAEPYYGQAITVNFDAKEACAKR